MVDMLSVVDASGAAFSLQRSARMPVFIQPAQQSMPQASRPTMRLPVNASARDQLEAACPTRCTADAACPHALCPFERDELCPDERLECVSRVDPPSRSLSRTLRI